MKEKGKGKKERAEQFRQRKQGTSPNPKSEQYFNKGSRGESNNDKRGMRGPANKQGQKSRRWRAF